MPKATGLQARCIDFSPLHCLLSAFASIGGQRDRTEAWEAPSLGHTGIPQEAMEAEAMEAVPPKDTLSLNRKKPLPPHMSLPSALLPALLLLPEEVRQDRLVSTAGEKDVSLVLATAAPIKSASLLWSR